MTSTHALDRINNRLNGIITPGMVEYAERMCSHLSQDKYYLQLGNLGKTLYLPDGTYGDIIVAVIKQNTIVTVMLARSWKVTTYFRDGKYIPQ